MNVTNFRQLTLVVVQIVLSALGTSFCAAQQPGGSPQLSIRTSSLPRAFVSQAYHVQLQAQDGIAPYSWAISGGSLPKNLNLSEDGVLSGIPAEAGMFQFEITVTDGAIPSQQRAQELVLQIVAPLLAKWGTYPKVNGQRVDGSVKVSNQTNASFDLTVIVLAVNDIGRATALGYQHFTLEKDTSAKEVTFGENLPPGSYVVNADVVAEVPAANTIHRARLVTNTPLQLAPAP